MLKTQARSHYLVRHQEKTGSRWKPDLLIHDEVAIRLVLDTKWKLLDGVKANGSRQAVALARPASINCRPIARVT